MRACPLEVGHLIGIWKPSMHSLSSFPIHSQILSHSREEKLTYLLPSVVLLMLNTCCPQVLAAAATVSKLSTTVCGICKVAVTNTDNAQVKKELQRFVTRMTDTTATLLECIEVIAYYYYTLNSLLTPVHCCKNILHRLNLVVLVRDQMKFTFVKHTT